MRAETKSDLTAETIAAIQELIEINIDSYNGFKQATEHISDSRSSEVLDQLAQQRVKQAAELQKLILRNDEDPITEGSIAGRIHRSVMDWRDAMGGGPLGVLKEAKRGEDYIKAKYEAILSNTAGSAVTDTLNQQYAAVKKANDRVRDLQAALAATSQS